MWSAKFFLIIVFCLAIMPVSTNANTGVNSVSQPAVACNTICGDVNFTGTFTFGDALYIFNYYFAVPGFATLPCPEQADVDSTDSITVRDAAWITNFIFDKDKPPCLGLDPGNCWTPEQSGTCCLAVP